MVGWRVEMDRDCINSSIGGFSGRYSGCVAELVKKLVLWVWQKAAAMAVVLLVLFSIYEFNAPIYSTVSFSNVERTERGIRGELTFVKGRDCAPVRGTTVAFVNFADVQRRPVRLLNADGTPIVLKNFPPSVTPVKADLTWELDESMPVPTDVSLTFELRCITPIAQRDGFGPLLVALPD